MSSHDENRRADSKGSLTDDVGTAMHADMTVVRVVRRISIAEAGKAQQAQSKRHEGDARESQHHSANYSIVKKAD